MQAKTEPPLVSSAASRLSRRRVHRDDAAPRRRHAERAESGLDRRVGGLDLRASANRQDRASDEAGLVGGESCARTRISPQSRSMSSQTKPRSSEIPRPLKSAVSTRRRPRAGQDSRSLAISSWPSTRPRERRGVRGRSCGSSSSTGSAVIQPRRRAKRSTLCRVARAFAVVFGERPAARRSSISPAMSSTVIELIRRWPSRGRRSWSRWKR